MNRWILLICLSFFSQVIYSQSGDLIVQGVAPDMHLIHTVAPKENWYSIGRIYNISPKEIAPFNNLTMDKPLSIGQKLKIPLNATNFVQSGSKSDNSGFVPVYHVIQDKEWAFRVSTNYNKVPVENLEKWNGINKDQIKAGTKLIVGYLKVKGMPAGLKQEPVIAKQEPSAKQEPVKHETAKQEPVKTEPVKQESIKQEEKVTKVAPVEDKKVEATVTTVSNKNFNGGFFKSQFEQSGKNSAGNAGVFKSNSGWQDGKYYALMNNVPVGTIVKITNSSSDKAVYAKILGNLADMKENVGLHIRVSDAAAAELGAGEAAKFQVEVKY